MVSASGQALEKSVFTKFGVRKFYSNYIIITMQIRVNTCMTTKPHTNTFVVSAIPETLVLSRKKAMI